MNKLDKIKLRLKLWNRWRKHSHWSPWKKFLVLIGRKHSPVLDGMYFIEGVTEGLMNVGATAKKMSYEVEKVQQVLKDKLGVVSPSNPGGRSTQMTVYDEMFGKEEATNE